MKKHLLTSVIGRAILIGLLMASGIFASCGIRGDAEESGTSQDGDPAQTALETNPGPGSVSDDATLPETEPDAGNPGEKLWELLRSSSSLKSKCELVCSINAPSGDFYPQGGCFDGKYYYQAFINRDRVNNEENNIDRIVKVDAATGKVVKTSGDLALNHANDIAVCADGLLAVVHNNPNRQNVSLIDPETLTLVRTEKIAYQIYCLDYCEERDSFVIGLSGGQDFRLLNGALKPGTKYEKTLRYATPLTKGYTTQGCACDSEFVYFVLYDKSVITVYDWDGNLITIIELSVGSIEPENISVIGDGIYITCAGGGGAQIYRVTPYAG
ncbi:MAG: hypothetical protein ILP01_00155 [Clostridia bacterium]|nr:hypothetical protein [Clostridia bacterium]